MKILVISAHPDDETLGCGGTLLKHRDRGDRIFWLIVTSPGEPHWTAETMARKAGEIESVSRAYGMEEHTVLGFPAIHLETVARVELIERIRKEIERIKPEIVYLVHAGDIHSDHYVTFASVMSVLRPSYMASLGVRRILCYETLSSTEATTALSSRYFLPNVFSDITGFLEGKIETMSLYQTEMQKDPKPRGPSAIRALARYRGATIGVDHAEGFMLVREISD
jgi:LmbE family N-acetylglucosaminyl deacetylase